MSKTAYAVVGFIIILVLAGYSMKANADEFFSIGVGQTMINSHLKTGEITYHIHDWEFQAALQEAGDTKRGDQDKTNIYSVSYVTDPNWGFWGIDPYLRLGVSHNDNSPLVGDVNFRLGAGLNFHDVWRVEFSHHSSAGISQVNTGIDYITINYLFDPFWK